MGYAHYLLGTSNTIEADKVPNKVNAYVLIYNI